MKYKLFLILLLVLSGLPIASATFSLENYANPIDDGSKYGKIEVYDGNLIFPDEKIATFTLKENSEQCLTDCYASGEVTLFREDKLLNKLDFLNGKIKDYRIYIINGESYEIDVPIYNKTCVGGEITPYADCTETQIGTSKETRYRDLLYDGKKLIAGTYQWRIEGKKSPYDNIDWIITTANDVSLDTWAWWNGAWAAKKKININITDPTSYGNVSALLTVTYDSDMQTDFDDIRFVDGIETNELSYWFYNNTYTASTSVNVWVKLNTNISSASNQTIYMYYKNPSATTTSNISNAFLFGDDFVGSEVNYNVWNTTGAGNFSVSSGTLVAVPGSYTVPLSVKNINFTNSYSMEARFKPSAIAADSIYLTTDGQTHTAYGSIAGLIASQFRSICADVRGGNPKIGEYYKMKIDLPTTGNINHTFINDSGQYIWNNVCAPTNRNGFLNIGNYQTSTTTYDWVYVKRLTTSPPSATFGAEEENTGLTATHSYPDNLITTADNTVGLGCNFTSSGATNIAKVNVTVWNSLGAITYGNTTEGLSTKNYNATWTTSTLSDGVFTWGCSGYGDEGTNATTTNRTFTVDTTSPTISISSPSGIYIIQNVSLNYSVTDLSVQSCWYSTNNGVTNISIASCLNTSLYLNVGNNTLRVYANDTLGNLGTSALASGYYFPQFSLCNTTNTLTYVNFTFKNETITEENTVGTFSSTFIYWFDQEINRTLTFVNATVNPSYSFCIAGANNTLTTEATIQYSNLESPTRTYTNTLNLINVTTNITLWLLPTTAGLDVTFQVVDGAGGIISSALVNATRSGNLISSQLTDGSGTTTMFLNPLNTYTICASKTGYTTTCTSITPASPPYTIVLGGTAVTPVDYNRGVDYVIRPSDSFLYNGTGYNFNWTVTSSYWTLDSFGFRLYNASGDQMAFNSSTANGGTLNAFVNTGTTGRITMNGYWIINSSVQNVTREWIIYDAGDSGWSIAHFFNRLNSYTNSSSDSDGLFGLRNTTDATFSYSLIIFLIIFVSTGILCYSFGFTSPAAIMGVMFGIVFFFDYVLEIVPRPIMPGLPVLTILTGTIMLVFLFKEVQQ